MNNDEERTQHNREGQAQHNSIRWCRRKFSEIKQESANLKIRERSPGARPSSSANWKVKAEKDKQLTDKRRE